MSINDKDLPPSILLLAHFINLALLSSALPEEGDVDDDDDDDDDDDVDDDDDDYDDDVATVPIL